VSPDAPETKSAVEQSADTLYQVAVDLCRMGRLEDAEVSSRERQSTGFWGARAAVARRRASAPGWSW